MMHSPKPVLLFVVVYFALGSAAGVLAQELVTIENDTLAVSISPLGAELQSIRHKSSGAEYLWQGDPAHWSGRAPIMFPVNVRFKDERFISRGVEYEMPRMGLAVIETFKVKPSGSPDVAVLELAANPTTLRHYPFEFRLEITFRLEGNALVHEFVVENKDDETMYFALGGHPAQHLSGTSSTTSPRMRGEPNRTACFSTRARDRSSWRTI